MIQKHYSLKHADKILNKLFEILGKTDDDTTPHIVVECWANCREQGYVLKQWDRPCVAFAKHRNAEGTRIIFGKSDEFDLTTNMPATHLWVDSSMTYIEEDDDEAVAFIIDKLGIIEAQLTGKTL